MPAPARRATLLHVNGHDPQLVREAQARVGSVLRGKWRVDRLLDLGGMAAVFAATHRNGNRVALKVLHRHLGEHQEVRERFMREGYAANLVGHPGAVQVLDDDQAEDGAVFLVMELLEGESLEGRLRRLLTLSPADALAIADPLLDVLAAAHDKGVIHRDIKPANVFLTTKESGGRVKLLDFGLARVREASFQVNATRDGAIVGTAAYMAPEQAQGKSGQVDARADQWSVAALIFTSITGRVVHEARNMVDRIVMAATTPPRSLATVAPRAPASLVALVDRALSFDREARFADARAMRAAVQSAAALIGAGPARPSVPPKRVAITLDPAALESIASFVHAPIDGAGDGPEDEERTLLMESTRRAQRLEVVGTVPDVAVSVWQPAKEDDPSTPKR